MRHMSRPNILAAPVTLPLLPAPADATPAVEGGDLREFLDNYRRLPPGLQEVAAAFIHGLAEYERKRRGMSS